MYPLQEVFDAYDGKHKPFEDYTDEDLKRFHRVCSNCQPGDTHSDAKRFQISRMIELMLAERGKNKRQLEKIQEDKSLVDIQLAEQKGLNQTLIDHTAGLHGKTMGELGKIEKTVERLGLLRLFDKVMLIAAIVAALAAVVGVVIALAH